MVLEFEAIAIWWRGPAPYVYVPIPQNLSDDIKAISSRASYGWGCIPVRGSIGETNFKTSLFPHQGIYLVPVKVAVQRAEDVKVGDSVRVRLEIDVA